MSFDKKEIFPNVVSYSNIFNKSKEVIEICKNENLWEDSLIGSNNRKEKQTRSSKKTEIDTLLFNKYKIFQDLVESIWLAADNYAKEKKFSFSGIENVEILKYNVSEDFYDYHYDYGIGNNRVVSSLLYLNDVDCGGETHFKYFNKSVKPEENKIVVFPSNYAYTHSAIAPKSGVKYVAVAWFYDS